MYTDCRLPLQCLCVCWSGLKLPWLELDWFMDLSSRITKLDLSSNCLAALPSVVPWGLIQLHTLDLSNNNLKDLPSALSSQEIICSKYAHTHTHTHTQKHMSTHTCLTNLPFIFKLMCVCLHLDCGRLQQVNLSQNQLTSLPTGLLHLTRIQRLSASKNQLTSLFDLSNGAPWCFPVVYISSFGS